MQEHAEVIRLESQLTVPTRDRNHLSDLWIAIKTSTRLAVWAEAFARMAVTYDAGTLQLVRMSDQRGWVVARGVDLRLHSPADVETKVRELVALANRATGASVATSPVVPSVTPWGVRVGSVLRASGNAARFVVAASPPRRKIDASSAR